MESRHYTISSTVLLQTVDDETLLYDSSTELFFGLNEVGALLWESMQQHQNLRSVYEEMLSAFDVEPERLESDLQAFAEALSAQGLITFDTN